MKTPACAAEQQKCFPPLDIASHAARQQQTRQMGERPRTPDLFGLKTLLPAGDLTLLYVCVWFVLVAVVANASVSRPPNHCRARGRGHSEMQTPRLTGCRLCDLFIVFRKLTGQMINEGSMRAHRQTGTFWQVAAPQLFSSRIFYSLVWPNFFSCNLFQR